MNDLNNPTAGTLTPSYKSVTVNWTKGTSGVAKDTLVLRSTSSTKPTPVGGTTYNTGDTVTLGGNSYKVVHRGNATSATDSGLEPGTTYYYYFYAENNTYYSSGVYKSTTTTSPSGDNVYWSSSSGATSGAWEQSGKNLWYYTSLAGDYPKVNTWGAQNVYIDNDFKPDQYLTEDTSVKSLTYNTTTAHKLYGSSAMTAVTGSTLTLGGGLTNKVNGTHVIGAKVALGAATTMDIQAGGIIVSGVVSGAYAITKKGSGTLTLSATNTYSGGTTINAGTVVATMAKSLGTGAATIASDATLELNPAAARTLANTFTVNGGTIKNTAKANVLSKAVTLGADSTVEVAASSLRLTGAVGGSYKLTKTGAGTLILCGTNTYSGGTAVSAGTLTASNSAAAMGTGTVTLSSGTTLNLNPVTAKTYANTLVVNGATIKNTIKDNVLSGGVTLGGNSTVNVAEAADTLTMSGIINSGTSSYGLTKSGSGTLKLSGVNTYKGATAVSAGTLQFTDASGLGTTAGATTVASDATLNYAPASTGTTVSEPVTLNGGTLSLTANNATWGGAVTLGANSTVSAASSKNLTVTGIISGSGKALTKEGDGTVTLGAANTYSGATTVNAGTLAIANGGAIAGNLSVASGATASVTKNSGVTWTYGGVMSGSGSFTKAGAGTLIVTGANTFDGTTTVSAGTLQIGNGGTTGSWADDMGGSGTVAFNRSDAITYAGVLGGTLKLTKQGAGTLTLSGTSTMSGATTVSEGTLVLSGSLASSAVTVESGGTLSASGTPSVGSLTVKSGGALTVSRANTLSSGGAADLKNGAVVNFDATGWSKAGSTMSWTIFAGGSAASVGTVTLNVTAATGTSAGEYTIAASGNNVVVTWTKATTAPVIGSPTAASIAPTSATLGGTVTSDGNDTITEYGVVWSTSANPTTGSHVGGGISTASGAPTIDSAFTRSATGLTAGTTYHYRAYAKNGVGTSYTDDATFTAPTVVGLSTTTFTYPGAGNTLTLTGTGGSGSGAYSYAIQSTSGSAAGSIGTGANYNKLTVTACGTTSATGSFTIRVTKAADAPYASQYADVVVTVNKASQTLTFANSTFGADTDSHTVSATGLGSPTITYTGNADAVATVTSAGAMTRGTTGYGTVTVTASAAESANYLSATKTATVTVMGKRPTSNPTKLTFTATGTTTANIVVRRASDSTGIVIVMRAGAAPTTAPTDGSRPSANTAYGTAGAALGDSYVVYANTGGGSSDHTVQVTGLTAGTTYYVVAYPYMGGSSTYSYKSTGYQVIGTTPPNAPTLAAAADGKTMVRLNMTKPSGTSGGMVLVYGGSDAPSGAPGAAGTALGGGTIVWKGTATTTGFEHVVPAGATHGYRLFAYAGSGAGTAYSASSSQSLSTAAISGGQVETFSYTNGTGISSTYWNQPDNGWSSTGWAAWDSSSSYIKIAQPAINGKGLLNSNRLNQAGGNAMDFNASNATRVVRAYRAFDSAYTSGKVWFMFSVRTEFGGDEDGKTFGAQFMSTAGDSSTIFASVGKPPDRYTSYPGLAVDTSKNGSGLPAGSSITWGGHNDSYVPNYSLADYGHGSPAGNNEATNYHTIYGYIDLSASNNKMYVNAAYSGTVFTNSSWEREPTTWDVNGASISASSVAGMTLYSVGYCGRVQFDEVRVASSWEELLGGSLQTPDDFTAFAADRDGNEMVRWTFTAPANSKEIVIIDKTNSVASALTATEMALKSAAVGTEAGKAIVAYRGPAVAGSSYEVDHVVKPGTSHAYYAYAVNVTEYSENCKAATGNPVTTDPYESWEKLDTFSYTNGVQVSASGNAWKGGQGWGDNYWGSSGSGNWYSLKPGEVPSYVVNHVTNYPDSVGNVICVTNLGVGQNATFNRVVQNFGGSSGTTIYFAYRMAYAHSGDGNNRWAGIEFVSDVGGEKYVFVGKAAATDHRYHLGITATGASSPCWPNVGSGGAAYELKGLSDATVGRNAYLVVGKIQWVSDTLVNVFANAFYTGGGNAMLPENEPSWGSYGYSGATLGSINSIRFKAGADPDHGAIGYAYFDELRWGTSWEQLLAGKAPTDVWMDGQTTHVYTGDIVTNAITSEPKGAKQSAQSLVWTSTNAAAATWTSHAIAAGFYTNKASDTQTEWHGVHQITNVPSSTTLTLYGLGAVTGNGTTKKSVDHSNATYRKHTYTVRKLTAPSLSVTPGDFRENLSWTRATGYSEAGSESARTFNEVMVVRYSGTSATNLATLLPVDGTTYYEGSTIYYNGDPSESRYMTVVYRGSDATSCVDSGLAKSNTYHYAAFTVNNSHYSPRSDVKSGKTTGTSTTPTVDGNTPDWVGGASATPNSAAYSEEEFIWTDKNLDGRENTDTCFSADIREFRVKATASTVYFLLRLAHSNPTQVVPTNAYITVGVDTRRKTDSAAMNWLGDEAATFVGGGYWQTNGAIHFPERQMAVHRVGGSENTWQVEMYADNGAEWYAPKTSWAAACSASASGDPCIEWSVAREDLGLTGACTGRFTVASFVNSGAWNNQGAGTVRFDASSCAAVDSMEIVPYGVNDPNGNLGSWDEGLKDGNVNFWADVRFKADGLDTHAVPSEPTAGVEGTTGTEGGGSPKLQWTGSSVTDGFVTGYLLEVATNAAFGAAGDTLLYRVNIEGANSTNYQTRTSVSNFYWRVRARSNSGILSPGQARPYTVTGKKDVDGPLAKLLYVGTNVMAFINNTVDPATGIGYRDDQERSGDATSVEDSDLQDGGHVFGFVIEWYDVNGVYATNRNRNTGEFAWNILAEHADGNPYGRVSPNWDLIILDRKATSKPSAETVDGVSKEYTQGTLTLPTENGGTETLTNCWYIDCGKDAVFSNAETINDGNSGLYVTNYVTNAFRFGGYRDGVELYLTVSAEDSNTQGASGPGTWFSGPLPNKSGSDPEGSWGPDARPAGVNCSGYCADGPNSERNVTTNQLLKFYVRDNDATPPVASTNVWGAAATNAAGAKFTPSLVISTGTVANAETARSWASIPGKLAPISGAGRDVTYQLTDQVIGATNLTFLFNVYDDYLHSGLRVGTSATSTGASGRMLTNTAFKVLTWDGAGTNWLAGGENTAKYASSLSTLAANGTGAGTVLAWTFADSTHPVTEASLESLFGVPNILSTIGTNSAGATNLVQLHAWDRDDNRTGDQADAELTFGKLMLTDDDATAPAADVSILGTGTNFTHFGKVAQWGWGSGDSPSLATNGLKGITVGEGAVTGYVASAAAEAGRDATTNLTWSKSAHVLYHSGNMGGDAYRSEGSRYVEFKIHGTAGSEWIVDMAGFHNRVSKLGPTKYTLTAQAPELRLTVPGTKSTTALNDGWTGSSTVTVTARGGSYGVTHTIDLLGASVKPSLTSTNIPLASYVSGTLKFKVGYTYNRTHRRLKCTYSLNNGISWNDVGTYDNTDTEMFPDTAANGTFHSVQFPIPIPNPVPSGAALLVKWELLDNTTASAGFVLADVSIVLSAGDDAEVELATIEMEKDLSDTGEYAETTTEVTMGFGGASIGCATNTEYVFRLYGYKATKMEDSVVSPSTGSSTWGINDFYLHGIVVEPKHNEVTDFDLRQGAWTNSLSAMDGAKTGYDTEQSGIWVGEDGTTNGPSFTLRYPGGYSAAPGGAVPNGSGQFTYKNAASAKFDTFSDDFSSAGGWTNNAGASIDTAARCLVLPDNSSQSSAYTVRNLSSMSGVRSLTVSGSFEVKAKTAESSGGTNGIEAVVAFLNSGGSTLYTAPAQAYTAVAAKRTFSLAPIDVTQSDAAKVKVTLRQAGATGTEVDIQSMTLNVAQWGAPVEKTDTAGWAALVTNGMPGARFTVHTPEMSLASTAIPLSTNTALLGSDTNYTLVSLVHDYDRDRTDDALPAMVTNQFAVYDDDTMAPTNGSMFGGPLGVFLNGTIITPKHRTGSGTAQKWVLSDHELTALGATDPVMFSLSFYDYSDWETTTLKLGSTFIQNAGVAQGNFTNHTARGAAGIPSATNTWSIDAKKLYQAFGSAYDSENGNVLTMNATVTDLDNDRANDSMATPALMQVGQVHFFDQDVDAIEYGSQTAPYYGVMISTNVPSTGKDAMLSTNVNNPYVVGGVLSAHQNKPTGDDTLATTRTFTLYDGQLRQTSSDRLLVVTANLNDPRHHTDEGRAVSGLQRGTEAAGTQSKSLWGTTYTATNTYVAFETATVGGGTAPIAVISNMVFNDNFGTSIGQTRNSMQAGHTSWTWSSFSREEVATLLPSGTSRDLYLNVYAFDSDTDRPNDQKASLLAGPKVVIRDDDTQWPNAPTAVEVNGTLVTGGTMTRETAPWTNNLDNVNVRFTAATDPAASGDDIKSAGIARYHLAPDGATLTHTSTNAGKKITTSVDGAKLRANLGAVTMDQGFGKYQLFAVDLDDDRPGDGLASDPADVPLAYDITKPTKIGYVSGGSPRRLTAIPDNTDDPTTQFDLSWPIYGVGPDDPEDPNYTNTTYKAGTYETLSPWYSYKIYFTNYDESAIAADDNPDVEAKSWVYQTFMSDPASARYYTNWAYVMTNSPVLDPSAPKSGGRSTAYDSLGRVAANVGTTNQSIRLYDLDFDNHYVVIIVGVDKAGNEGPAGMWSWATNNTIKFAITQGVIRASSAINAAVGVASGTNSVGMAPIPSGGAKKAAALYWMAAGMKDGVGKVSKYYDLIYRDAASFDETGTEQWKMATSAGNSGTSKTNWNYQADAGLDTPNRLRFYRASYAGRWQGSSPLASEEVYSMNNVVLSEGWNYVSLQGVPYTNTFRGVFGTDTNMWPGGKTASDTNATQVAFFEAGTNQTTNAWFYFGLDGEWYNSRGGKVTDTPQSDGFFARPFSLTLPQSNAWWDAHGDYEGAKASESKSVKAMLWHPIMQVPTNAPQASAQTIQKAAGTYNLLSLNLPVAVHPGELGLEAAGMCTNANPWAADKLYVIDSRTKEVRNDSMMYPDGTGKWFWVKDRSEVSGAVISPNDMLVILSSGNAANNWNWTYHPTNFYTLPTRHMGR